MDDQIPDNQREWWEGDTPAITVTLLDSTNTAIPLANVATLTLDEWVDSFGLNNPGKTVNSRNGQNAKNANGVTVASTSGLVTWQLTTADTAMQSKDQQVFEEKHWFRFNLTYNASGTTIAKSYTDYLVIKRKKVIAP